jgi:ABC-2 type transport system permease protein
VKVLAIAGTNLRRLFRQRSNIFFVIIFPMLLILLLGATFGGAFTPVLGVVDQGIGPLGEDLVATLEKSEDLEVKHYSSEAGLVDDVERGRVQAGLVVPAGHDDTIRAGDDVVLRLFARPGSLALRTIVEATVGEQSMLIRSARFAQSEGVASFDDALELAAQAAEKAPGVLVRTTSAGESSSSGSLGKFDSSASTQLLLFIFITSLTGSVALIETRRLGVARRMLSTPTAARTILAGEALGRFGIALLQGLIIMLGAALIFGVNWGNPVGAALVLIVFSLVGAGAGMLLGSTFHNDQQAGSVAPLLGLGLAALGGSMAPLEMFPDTMRTIAHVTPHAWGNDAFSDLVRGGGDVTDIFRELGVLAAFAVVLLTLATWQLRRAITG